MMWMAELFRGGHFVLVHAVCGLRGRGVSRQARAQPVPVTSFRPVGDRRASGALGRVLVGDNEA